MIWLPRPVLSKESVGENDGLAHDRGEGDLWLFTGGDETAVEQFERWVEAGREDGGHVQGFAHISAAASDVTQAIVFTTVVSDQREARDHGGLLDRQGADLVQPLMRQGRCRAARQSGPRDRYALPGD
jgi:hypothetical protein